MTFIYAGTSDDWKSDMVLIWVNRLTGLHKMIQQQIPVLKTVRIWDLNQLAMMYKSFASISSAVTCRSVLTTCFLSCYPSTGFTQIEPKILQSSTLNSVYRNHLSKFGMLVFTCFIEAPCQHARCRKAEGLHGSNPVICYFLLSHWFFLLSHQAESELKNTELHKTAPQISIMHTGTVALVLLLY